jgi:hypothetical protein
MTAITSSTVSQNITVGGTGGVGGVGATGFHGRGSDFGASGPGGTGGTAQGGGVGIHGGAVTFSGTTLSHNVAQGGLGGNGGANLGPSHARGDSGAGGAGGQAQGGGLYAGGATLAIDTSSVTHNVALGGNGGNGGAPNGPSGSGGLAEKGGVFTTGTVLTLTGSTIHPNRVINGSAGAPTPAAGADRSRDGPQGTLVASWDRVGVDIVFAHAGRFTERPFAIDF